MKTIRVLGVSAGILGVLSLAYFAVYKWVYHTDAGFRLRSSPDSALQKAPPEVRRALESALEPMRAAEEEKGLTLQKKLLPGEWTTTSGKYRAKIDAEYRVSVWGLAKEGLPDGAAQPSTWAQWGTGGTDSYLSVSLPGTSTRILEVFVDYEDHALLNVNVISKGADYGLEMQRKNP